MLELFAEYGLFLAKTLTFIVAIVIVIAIAMASGKVAGGGKKGRVRFRSLNEARMDLKTSFAEDIEDDSALKALRAEEKESENHNASSDEKRVFVVDFDGNESAESSGNLSHEIEAIVNVARPEKDEVVLRLKSPGGYVHAYGIAAEHLKRLRDHNIKLTACVDEIAASGGYMMAVVADRIVAAPFSTIGSVGVVASVPNINRMLEKHGVDYEDYTAGEYKRTVSMMGEITEEGKAKFIEELKEVHEAFKNHVQQYRSTVDVADIATGESWLGSRALEKGLVDEIGTSARIIQTMVKDYPVYKVAYKQPKEFSPNLAQFLAKTARLTMRGLQAEMAHKPKY